MYYRKDIFEDPAVQEAYKSATGNDLAVPTTYEEFDAVGRFLTEHLGPDVSGGAFQHAAGQAFDWYIGPFAGAGGQYFDPETMDATINSEIAVKVLSDMVKATEWMPDGIQTWDFVAVLSAWLDGKVAMIITCPPIGRWSDGVGAGTEQLSWVPETKVAGKVGYAPEPGGRSALAGGFSLGVSPFSKNKECAYLFAQWMNSPAISLDRVMLPFALRDPFRKEHYASDEYKAMWDGADEYLATLESAAMKGVYELGIPGAREYMDALDQAITAAYAGTDPQAALDTAAEKYNEITDRLGRDAQKAEYAKWLLNPWAQPGPK
jgi:multiple sugar transport system substrate-binding protein